MSVTVSIPTPLRSFTGGRDAVAVVGTTVGQVLDELLAAHPAGDRREGRRGNGGRNDCDGLDRIAPNAGITESY
jgi:molybdopterin converting factor small subunit